MARKMIVNAVDREEVRIAILDGRGRLEQLDIETHEVEKTKGNVYKGIVRAVQPSLNAAFVDYGAEKEGFLTLGEIDAKNLGNGERTHRITDLVKPGQQLLVQIETDAVGSKGAVLTTYLSFAGRYVVLMPGANRTGVSRRIDDAETRNRIRDAARRLEVPDGMGVIIRTAGHDRSKEDLQRDLGYLLRLWQGIEREAERAKAPALILKEQDVVIRSLRDYLTDDIDEVVVDSDEAFDRASEYMRLVMPQQIGMLTRYVERRPIFHHYRVEPQIDELYQSRVPLPSGGSLVIEPTEALVAIDVNSGKQKSGNHEETALRTDLEAAREVARHLRLRDLGGIIVVDFIDLESYRNQLRVERELKKALEPDKARVRVGKVSPNGTIELTRQRLRSALRASVFTTCQVCRGTGHVLNPESHAVAVIRRLRDLAARGNLRTATVRMAADAANHLREAKIKDLQAIEAQYNVQLTVTPDRTFAAGHDDLTFTVDPNVEPWVPPEPDFGPPPGGGDDAMIAQSAAERAADRPAPADDGEAKAEAAGGRSRRRRRRGRGKGRGEDAAVAPAPRPPNGDDAEPLSLAMPSFELLELDAVAPAAGEAKDEAKNGKRRRRRRGRGRGRGTELTPASAPEVGPAPEAAPAMPPPTALEAVRTGGGITGFFRRLFGG